MPKAYSLDLRERVARFVEGCRSGRAGRIVEKADIPMPELSAELATASGTKADPASLSRWLIRNGYRFKKNPAGERARSSRHQSGGALGVSTGSILPLNECADGAIQGACDMVGPDGP